MLSNELMYLQPSKGGTVDFDLNKLKNDEK